MDIYADRIIALAENPLNLGRLEGADGEGFAGSECGDWVRMWVKLDDSARIVDARFECHGCASAVASSSVLTELAKGKRLDEAGAITLGHLASHLGGGPEHESHCSEMSHLALQRALGDCRQAREGAASQ